MIKAFFYSLATFFSFCGVFIPLGSLLIFSLTTATSGPSLLDVYKLLLELCKLLSTWELLFNFLI